MFAQIPEEYETIGYQHRHTGDYICLHCAAREQLIRGGSHLRYLHIKENERPSLDIRCQSCGGLILQKGGYIRA